VAGKTRSSSTTSISPAPRHRPCRAAYWLGALPLPPGLASAHEPHAVPPDYPDTPAFSGHIKQVDVASGPYGFKEPFVIGGDLYMRRRITKRKTSDENSDSGNCVTDRMRDWLQPTECTH
jgi:hypothetical protein